MPGGGGRVEALLRGPCEADLKTWPYRGGGMVRSILPQPVGAGGGVGKPTGPSDELQCEVMKLLLAGQCARLITGASSPSLPVSHTGPQDESSTLKSSLVTVTEWSDSSDV